MPFIRFSRKYLKKRYLVLALFAVELASLPAAAKIIERFSVIEAPTASVVLIDAVEGRKRFAVASNAPFYIRADNLSGPVSVKIHKSGKIGPTRFGDNAQMPGVALACSSLTGETRVVYQSQRETSLDRGEILSQAVVVAIHFEQETNPSFHIDVGEADSLLAERTACNSNLA